MNDRAPNAAPGSGQILQGLGALYWFSALDALSFQPVLSSPMVDPGDRAIDRIRPFRPRFTTRSGGR